MWSEAATGSWSPQALQRAGAVRLAGFDIDGTLTDGRLWIGASGEQFKAFHVHDGLGLKLLREAGIVVLLVTARRSAIVGARAAELGISEVIQGCRQKRDALAERCSAHGLELAQAAFMGDDLPDLPALLAAGLAAAPANATPAVAARVHWRSRLCGGEGAVREFCEGLLAAQQRLDGALARYLA